MIQNLFDYEDLIFKTIELLESDGAYRQQCRDRFQYLFVDEYQDLNRAQFRLIKALAPADGNICVIGDPDQAIYGFRGSDYRYFLNFKEAFSKAETVLLEQNYRSTQLILDAAYQVMEGHQSPLSGHAVRRVFSDREGDQKSVPVFEMSSEFAEADGVAKTIEKLVGGAGYHAVDAGQIDQAHCLDPIGFSDIAILYRTRDQHRMVAESLSRYGIPYQVAGRSNEGDVTEIDILLSLFKVVNGNGHYGDFEKVIATWQPAIGKETVFLFSQWGLSHEYALSSAMNEARRFPIPGMSRLRQEKLVDLFKIMSGFSKQMEGMRFSDSLKFLLTHTRLERLINEKQPVRDACHRLLNTLETQGVDADAFFLTRALETEIDTVLFDVQKVKLMTIHAAKGLEFPVVFIVGCEDELIPFRSGPDRDDEREEEERRLFFVAMTRAKHHLFLSWSRKRKRHGKNLPRKISPFVSCISPDLLVHQEPVYGRKKRQVQTQMKLF